MMGKMNLAALVGVALALTASVAAQVCDGGIPGYQSTSVDVCCTLECGYCGGPGCTPGNDTELTALDCCSTEIVASGLMCDETGAAPCILSTEPAPANSTCDNGQTGIQDPDTDVCCPLECGDSCGGEGCGTIPGVDSSLCCATQILASGVTCGEGVDPPCAVVSVATNNTTCSNGLAGVEDSVGEYCCDAACGECGGVSCGDMPGLTGADCCLAEIEATGELCSVAGSAPCIIDIEVTPSTCPNGLAGVADGSVCCAEACNGVCGGVGCGTVAGTNGAEDCCSVTILAAGISCGDGVTAPCIMVNGTYTPAPATLFPATLSPLAPGETSAPTAASRDISFTMAPTPSPAGTSVPTSAPSLGSRGIDFPSEAPTSAPTMSDRDILASMAPSGITLPPDFTLPPVLASGSSSLSAGSVVTVAAMLSGMFAVFAAARN